MSFLTMLLAMNIQLWCHGGYGGIKKKKKKNLATPHFPPKKNHFKCVQKIFVCFVHIFQSPSNFLLPPFPLMHFVQIKLYHIIVNTIS